MPAYDSYQFLYPPRPSGKPIAPMSIGIPEKAGYWAQKKKNGTCSVIFARGSEVIFKKREGPGPEGDHRFWSPKDAHLEFFGSLGPKWNVFAAELLHAKGPSVKDELYIFDVMVHEGEYLVGTTFAERMAILSGRWSKTWKDEGDQYRVHKHVTVAKTYSGGFRGLFNNLGPMDEGLVFKLPTAKLKPCVSDGANAGWSQKCRDPKAKIYSF